MHDEIETASSSEVYAYGDEGAGKEVDLPKHEIRKMRLRGKLEGAWAKIGHRSIIYHRGRLRRRIDEAFKAQL